MISLSCRPLTRPDLPQALMLDQLCFGGFWSQSGYEREMVSPNSDLLVLVTDERPDRRQTMIGIGCLWAILEEAHITLLGIMPEFQRQGLGQWLLLHLLTAAQRRGLTHATLEVRVSNQGARSLYEKFGFQVAGERRKYYADGESALILWQKGLQETAFAATLQTLTTRLQPQLAKQGWQVVPPGDAIRLPPP